jgi:hypothetical protein
MNPGQSREQVIAELEMLATAIGTQAEQVGRIASQVLDDSHRLELWAIAMALQDESNAAREQARVLWSVGLKQ